MLFWHAHKNTGTDAGIREYTVVGANAVLHARRQAARDRQTEARTVQAPSDQLRLDQDNTDG